MTEHDEEVEDLWRISHGNYSVKMIDEERLEDDVQKINTMPLHLRAFVLSNSKKIRKISIIPSIDFIQTMFIIQMLTHYTLKAKTGIGII